MLIARNTHPVRPVTASALLAWLGLFVHNVADLPGQTPLSPESSLPALVTAVLVVGWWQLPLKRLTAGLLLGWGLLHLIGGAVLSVLPLSILPFSPVQSLKHYLFHLVYGLAQLPLISVVLAYLFRSGKGV